MSIILNGNTIEVRKYKEKLTLGLQNWQINNIKEILGLNKLLKLENLFLGGNQIKRITCLDNLKNLHRLDLQVNIINEISGLDELINLYHLDLGGNLINEIQGLDNLSNLHFLEVWVFPNKSIYIVPNCLV